MMILKMIIDNKTMAYYFVWSAGIMKIQVMNYSKEKEKITWYDSTIEPLVIK